MNAPVEDQICEQGYGIIKRLVDQARVDELSRMCDEVVKPIEQ